MTITIVVHSTEIVTIEGVAFKQADCDISDGVMSKPLTVGGIPANTADVTAYLNADADRLWVIAQSVPMPTSEELQTKNALRSGRSLMTGLAAQSSRDASYAIVARSYAIVNDASPATIAGIVDRPTASAYIQSTTRWAALTTAQRQMWTNDLEAEAVRTQALIALLR